MFTGVVPDRSADPSTDGAWVAAGGLLASATSGLVRIAADTHAAISRRVASGLPPAAEPVMATERAVASTVYALLAKAHDVAPRSVGRLADALVEPASTARVAAAALPVSNALWGDRVETEHPRLAIPMAVRIGGRDLPLSPTDLAAAFPAATGHLVVFVHGLAGDERWWRLGTANGTGSYADRLMAEHGLTPVVVRYNSGRRISDNGRDLSGLLTSLTHAWPVPLESVNLVGHSMGGLVARSACHAAYQDGAPWLPLARVLVTLGSPHLGAPLEKTVHVADRLLRLLPETEPLSRPLAARSVGVKDLRYGSLVEDDWAGHDPDEWLRDRCTQVPLVPHITYYWVASTLSRDPSHPVGRLLGDGLVLPGSARGASATRRIGFDEANGRHVGGASHLSLMNHPEVYEQLAVWLRPPFPQSAGC